MDDERGVPPEYFEIDALLDGEPVDRTALRRVLDDAGARHYLIEAMLVRTMIRGATPRVDAAPAVGPAPHFRGLRRLAAVLTLIGAIGGAYVYGRASGAEAPTGAIELATVEAPAHRAPAPTRFIRFEPGVTWTTHTRRQ